MSVEKYRVTRDENRCERTYLSNFNAGDLVILPPDTPLSAADNDGEVMARLYEGGYPWHYIMADALEPYTEPEPDIGREIEPEDVRPGDIIRVVEGEKDVEWAVTIPIQKVNLGTTEFMSVQGVRYWYGAMYDSGRDVRMYLVSRTPTAPEVEAIVTALDVDYETAVTMHSKGVRIHND